MSDLAPKRQARTMPIKPIVASTDPILSSLPVVEPVISSPQTSPGTTVKPVRKNVVKPDQPVTSLIDESPVVAPKTVIKKPQAAPMVAPAVVAKQTSKTKTTSATTTAVKRPVSTKSQTKSTTDRSFADAVQRSNGSNGLKVFFQIILGLLIIVGVAAAIVMLYVRYFQ